LAESRREVERPTEHFEDTNRKSQLQLSVPLKSYIMQNVSRTGDQTGQAGYKSCKEENLYVHVEQVTISFKKTPFPH